MMYLLLSVSLVLQNLHPHVITRNFEITKKWFTSSTTPVTYWSIDFTLLFEYPYIFRRIKFGGEFGYRRRLGGLSHVHHVSVQPRPIGPSQCLASPYSSLPGTDRHADSDAVRLSASLTIDVTIRRRDAVVDKKPPPPYVRAPDNPCVVRRSRYPSRCSSTAITA